eukprot:Lithocolla_globosa_v1_NODE_1232_length_2753_cov_6.257969.p7 type:complete len:100 gc:universal NODE_1232_length_2753_cov_6.257969:1917-2216(+)
MVPRPFFRVSRSLIVPCRPFFCIAMAVAEGPGIRIDFASNRALRALSTSIPNACFSSSLMSMSSMRYFLPDGLETLCRCCTLYSLIKATSSNRPGQKNS